MARTTVSEVKQIIDTSLSDSVIDSYITGSNLLITQVLGSSSLPSELLAEIERWLTAHNIAMTRERMAKKEGAGGAYIEYTGESGTGLEATSYGQMVLTLDTTGTMKSLAKKPVKFTAIKKQLEN